MKKEMMIYDRTAYNVTEKDLDAIWHRVTPEMAKECSLCCSTCMHCLDIAVPTEKGHNLWCRLERK